MIADLAAAILDRFSIRNLEMLGRKPKIPLNSDCVTNH